jgi:hypothetical protein
MSLIQIMLINSPYFVLAYPVCHDSAALHGQQHLEVRIADHKHHALAIHSNLAYTSSTHVADLQWQAVPDDFPRNRH